MAYLSKKDAERIIGELATSTSEEIKQIVKKIKFPEKRIYIKGNVEIRKLLRKALNEKKKVKIRYYSYLNDEHTTRIIDVYKIHNDCIIAYCHLRREERTFVIERIRSAAILNERYTIPKNWTPESIILDK